MTDSPTVYVGSNGTHYNSHEDAALYAVDAATGRKEWAFTQPSGWVRSSPTVADGTVYVGCHDETLYAVDAATGRKEWAFTQPSDKVRSSPTVSDGTVYVGSLEKWGDDGTLYAVDARTGEQEWAFTHPSGNVESSPTVVEDPERGDSVGSRVMLGTLGHHDRREAGLAGTETSTGDTEVYTGTGEETGASESSPDPSFCPYCGTDHSEYPAAAFCPECGEEL